MHTLLRRRLVTSERCRLLRRLASTDHLDVWQVQEFRTGNLLELITTRDPVPLHATTLADVPLPQRGLFLEAWIGLLELDGVPPVRWAGINNADRLVLARTPAPPHCLSDLLEQARPRAKSGTQWKVFAKAVRLLARLARVLDTLHRIGIAHRRLSAEVVRFDDAAQLHLLAFDQAHVVGVTDQGVAFDEAVHSDLMAFIGLVQRLSKHDHEGRLASVLERTQQKIPLLGDQFLPLVHQELVEAGRRTTASTGSRPRHGLRDLVARLWQLLFHDGGR